MESGLESPGSVRWSWANAFRPLRDRNQRSVLRRLRFEKLEDRYLLAGGSLGELFVTQPVDEMADTQMIATSATASLSVQELAAEKLVADAITALSRDLIQDLEQRGDGGNMFVSPTSIATALAMAFAGARDTTAAQLAHVLHLDHVDPGVVHAGFSALLRDLNSLGESRNTVLSAASALWAQEGLPLLSEFQNIMESQYGGAINRYDFVHDPDGARTAINDWVSDETHQKIDQLFPDGSIKKDTRLVLVNAMYLKSQWLHPFREYSTYDQPFYLNAHEQITASMMHQSGSFRYLEKDGFQAVELPYADGRLSMVVILPTELSLQSAANPPLPANLNTWLKGLQWADVRVALPKFKIDTGVINLNNTLNALGLDLDHNQLDGIFPGNGGERYSIDGVFHRAYIDVDEQGTEAAAATGLIVSTTSVMIREPKYISFTADHAFHFVIRDNVSGSILFQGKVTHPVSGDGQKSDSGRLPEAGVEFPTKEPTAGEKDSTAPDAGWRIPPIEPILLPTPGAEPREPIASDPTPSPPPPSPPTPAPTLIVPVAESPRTDLPTEPPSDPVASVPEKAAEQLPPAAVPVDETPPTVISISADAESEPTSSAGLIAVESSLTPELVSLALASPAILSPPAESTAVDLSQDETTFDSDLQFAIAAILRNYQDSLGDRFGLGTTAIPIERQLRDRLVRNHGTP